MNLRDKTSRTSPTVILNASPDPGLLDSRTKLLNKAGYYTTAAHSMQEATQLAASMNFNLALICHSFGGREKMELSEGLRRLSPATAIVWLRSGLDNNECAFVSLIRDALGKLVV